MWKCVISLTWLEGARTTFYPNLSQESNSQGKLGGEHTGGIPTLQYVKNVRELYITYNPPYAHGNTSCYSMWSDLADPSLVLFYPLLVILPGVVLLRNCWCFSRNHTKCRCYKNIQSKNELPPPLHVHCSLCYRYSWHSGYNLTVHEQF